MDAYYASTTLQGNMMPYTKNYFVHYFSTDIKRNLRVTSLMKFFEDIAVLQSENLNAGLDYYEKEKCAWVMYKWDVKIYKYPKFMDEIKIITIPNAYKKFYANRLFEVRDKNDELLAEGNSIWIFLNTENKRPKAVPQIFGELYEMNPDAEIINIENPEPPKKITHEKEFQVRYYDIDTNDHVNNVQYVEWALEAIPIEIKNNYLLKRLKTIYKKEVNLGDRIKSHAEIIEKENEIACYHLISNHETEACVIETYWER